MQLYDTNLSYYFLRCFNKPLVEEIIAALDNEDSEWAEKTKNTMLSHSPTSLKVGLTSSFPVFFFLSELKKIFCLSGDIGCIKKRKKNAYNRLF